jgi:SAM-dependent methyltransferase
MLKSIARRTLPRPARRWLKARLRGPDDVPPVGTVRFGDLRRVEPISRVFGFDRGRPVDRYYIESFLGRHAADVRGRVLEVGDASYTRQFGGDRVTRSDVLHVSEGAPGATVVADLSDAGHVPSDAFDCVVLTQTLHLVYDVRAAIRTLHRILAPGGVLLCTFPGISQIDRYDWHDTWYWSFTALAARRMFGEVFPADNLTVETHGNVLAAVAFLQGLAVEELSPEELDHHDPDYEVTVAVRAVKESRP